MQGLEYEHVIKFWTNMWAYEPVKVLDEYVGIKETKIKGGSVRTLSSLQPSGTGNVTDGTFIERQRGAVTPNHHSIRALA